MKNLTSFIEACRSCGTTNLNELANVVARQFFKVYYDMDVDDNWRSLRQLVEKQDVAAFDVLTLADSLTKMASALPYSHVLASLEADYQWWVSNETCATVRPQDGEKS